MRDQLAREASINNRSLSQEITYRLQQSLLEGGVALRGAALQAGESPAMYGQQTLQDDERRLLACFRDMPPEQRLSLLTLLAR